MLKQERRSVAAYDINYDSIHHNILTASGFVHAAYQVLRTRVGGSLWLAPVCSSWVWVNLVMFEKCLRGFKAHFKACLKDRVSDFSWF